jgi:transcriptional regulator with XRE-family HTH domain
MPTVLRRLRLERGLSTRALGELVGVSNVTISNLERGRSQGQPRTRASLTRAMGVPVDVLLMPDTTNEKTPTA